MAQDDDQQGTWTPNQVVAYNLTRARTEKGWTQEQAAEVLAPHLGVKWSEKSFSAAERSVDGVRIREFSADEIVAFARAFELPVAWFLTPPAESPPTIRTSDEPAASFPPGALVDILYPTNVAHVWPFVAGLAEPLRSEKQRGLHAYAQKLVDELMWEKLGDLDRFTELLSEMQQRFSSATAKAEAEVGSAIEKMMVGAGGAEDDLDVWREWWPDADLTDWYFVRDAAKGEAERKAAQKLRVEPWQVALASLKAWGRSFSGERDAQVGNRSTRDTSARAVRAEVTQALVSELEDYLREKGVLASVQPPTKKALKKKGSR